MRRTRRIGAISLEETDLGAPDRATLSTALRAETEQRGIKALSWGPGSASLRARMAFLHTVDEQWPDVSDDTLMKRADDWLWPLLDTVEALNAIKDGALENALRTLIPWDRHRSLDTLAPSRLETPLGSAIIDYSAEGGPRVDIRVQELFGLDVHPAVMDGRVPLTLALLSPARRPLQITKDLPGFWAGSWAAVRAEMRGRYPRHPWPEDPANAAPTSRAKPRGH